jgi:predicted HTH domain antitoxin
MCLHVSLNLPAEVEERVRREVADLEGTARESLLLDLFRRGVLSHYELSQALGIDRFETDALLKARNVYEGSLNTEDLEEDWRTIEHLFGPKRS